MSTHIQDSHAFHGISLQVSITVAPENIDKFLAALKPCYDAVTAEPECTFFEVFHDMDTPGRFRFVENWSKSKEWFLKVYSLLQMPYRSEIWARSLARENFKMVLTNRLARWVGASDKGVL